MPSHSGWLRTGGYHQRSTSDVHSAVPTMFETLQAVSALAQTIQLVWRLWDLGFNQVKNARMNPLPPPSRGPFWY